MVKDSSRLYLLRQKVGNAVRTRRGPQEDCPNGRGGSRWYDTRSEDDRNEKNDRAVEVAEGSGVYEQKRDYT